MSRLILVRHGETVFIRASRYSGQQETALTPLGAAQHERVRARLVLEPISRVVSSDLRRCYALATVIAADHGQHAEPEVALREMDFGAWEGRTYAEAMATDRAAMVAFNRDPVGVAPPGGESLQEVSSRATACLDRLLHAHKGQQRGALVVVGHGGTLRALLCGLLAVPLARYWTLGIKPGSLTVLETYPRGPMVEVLNDTCHLEGLLP